MPERFNLGEYLVERHVREGRGGRTALVVAGDELTYADVAERVQAAAGGLRRLGVQAGDRVLLVMRDTPEFVAAFLGAMRIGAIALPVNPLLPTPDVGAIAAQAGCRVAILSAGRAEFGADLAAAAPGIEHVVLAEDGAAPEPANVHVHPWAQAMSDPAPGDAHPTTEDSPGFWLCTSGTTGVPKLAMHRHHDLRLAAEGYAREVLAMHQDDRVLSVGPMFHAYGLGASLAFPLAVGAAAVLEAPRPPKPARVAQLVREHQVTLFFAVPTFYAALLASDIPDDAFASVRHAVSAGEALPGELLHRFEERFGVELLDGVGSTEMVHIFLSNRPGKAAPGSLGEPVAGYDLRLVGDDGEEVGVDEPGQLWVRGATAATGYFNRPDATATTFQDGWVRTGDMYSRSPDGSYAYLGRADELFKVYGEWVSPTAVEATLAAHPAVLEAAVVPETGPDGLLRPLAYVVAAPGEALDTDELSDFCRSRLPGFMRPRRIVVVPALPKTAVGKIRRTALRERGEAAIEV